MRRRSESGFSLVELMIAMVVTLIVSGATYGLLASGQGAFRREPELTDRQQNIRVAMNLIEKDVLTAGVGMGAFVQAFTDGLDAVGPSGLLGKSDFLEVVGNDGLCPMILTGTPAIVGNNLNFIGNVPPCYPEPGMVMVIYPGGAKPGYSFNIHSAPQDYINFPPGQQPPGSGIQNIQDLNCPGPPGSCPPNPTQNPTGIAMFQSFRYEIAIDADGVPNLHRSETGGLDKDGKYVAAPAAAGGWQLVARGIEDLQVQYQNGNGAWLDRPGDIGCYGNCNAPTLADYNKMIRQVRVTLSARALAPNLLGQMPSALGVAVRGQLTTVITPPTAMVQLAQASPSPLWW